MRLGSNSAAVLYLLTVLGVGCDGEPTGEMDAGALVDAGAPVDAGAVDAGAPFEIVPPDELVLEPMEAPLDVDDGVLFTTLRYGPRAAQALDVFVHPDAAEPTALVVYIHGGGFVGGSRTSAYDGGTAMGLQYLVSQGVAYASIDYSLLSLGSETEGVIKSLHDARRALQLLRYYAGPLNIDPDRVGLVGSSAGAGTSLWLAFHDEMADPAGDVLDQQSTRVQVAVVVGTQATYDLFRWPPDVFEPTYTLTVEDLLADTVNAAQLVTFYGVSVSLVNDPEMLEAQLNEPEYLAYRQEVDMLAWMSDDDPPVYVRNQAADLAPGAMGFDLLHHPLHAAALADRAAEAGLAASFFEAPALMLGGDENATRFLLDQLAP